MKNITKKISLLMLALFFVSAVAFADEVKIVSNPHCGECKTKIEKGLDKMSGVESANVDVKSKIVTVNYNPAVTNTDKIMQAIKDLGFTASLYDGKTMDMQNMDNKKCCKQKKGNCKCKKENRHCKTKKK